jgi:hypothetical protein
VTQSTTTTQSAQRKVVARKERKGKERSDQSGQYGRRFVTAHPSADFATFISKVERIQEWCQKIVKKLHSAVAPAAGDANNDGRNVRVGYPRIEQRQFQKMTISNQQQIPDGF